VDFKLDGYCQGTTAEHSAMEKFPVILYGETEEKNAKTLTRDYTQVTKIHFKPHIRMTLLVVSFYILVFMRLLVAYFWD